MKIILMLTALVLKWKLILTNKFLLIDNIVICTIYYIQYQSAPNLWTVFELIGLLCALERMIYKYDNIGLKHIFRQITIIFNEVVNCDCNCQIISQMFAQVKFIYNKYYVMWLKSEANHVIHVTEYQ